jgi:hypothetical protein
LLILNSTNRILPLKFNDNVPTHIVEPEDEDQIINFETLADTDTATINKFDDSDNSTFITIDTTGRKQHDQSGHLPLYYKCMGQWIWFYKN